MFVVIICAFSFFVSVESDANRERLYRKTKTHLDVGERIERGKRTSTRERIERGNHLTSPCSQPNRRRVKPLLSPWQEIRLADKSERLLTDEDGCRRIHSPERPHLPREKDEILDTGEVLILGRGGILSGGLL